MRADGEVIAAFTKNQVDPHFEGVRAGVAQMAEKMRATVKYYTPTKPNNITEGMSQLEDVGVTKPNLMLFMPIDAKAQLPTIKRLIESGLPIINYNDRGGDAPYLSFVGQDDYKLGYDIAKTLFDHLGGKGNVVILEGVKGSTTGDERKRGFDAAAKDYPNIKVLASQPANFQRLLGMQTMENLIQQFSTIDGVIAAADASALGADRGAQCSRPQERRGSLDQWRAGGCRSREGRQPAGNRRVRRLQDRLRRHRGRPECHSRPECAEADHDPRCDHHQGQLCAVARPLQGPDLPDAGRVYREVAPTGLQTRRVLQACLPTWSPRPSTSR